MGACGRAALLEAPEAGGGEEPLSTCWDHADPVPDPAGARATPLLDCGCSFICIEGLGLSASPQKVDVCTRKACAFCGQWPGRLTCR